MIPENTKKNNGRSIIRETSDLLIYSTNNDGSHLFVKEAKSENGIAMNKREFHNQFFLKTITERQDAGFEFLPPAMKYSNLIYPDINKFSDWLANDHLPETKVAPLSQYVQEMIKFIRFCLNIEFSKIPLEIKDDAKKRSSKILNKFEKDVKFLLKNNIIKIAVVKKLEEKVRLGLDLQNQAFQHHDVVPWHMARKYSDNKLILIDSGWAGWSLKYYDVAYYVLQMIGYAEKEKEALEFLNIVKSEFADDPKFRETLAIPLSYRGIRLSAELIKQDKTKNAQAVLSAVFAEI
jgi:hypothetical protein